MSSFAFKTSYKKSIEILFLGLQNYVIVGKMIFLHTIFFNKEIEKLLLNQCGFLVEKHFFKFKTWNIFLSLKHG